MLAGRSGIALAIENAPNSNNKGIIVRVIPKECTKKNREATSKIHIALVKKKEWGGLLAL